MQVYGFTARVFRDGDWFIGEIPELHVHDQAKTLRELEEELKDAVDTAVAFSLEHPGTSRKSLKTLFTRT